MLLKRLKRATKSSTFQRSNCTFIKRDRERAAAALFEKHHTLSLAMEVLRKEFEETLPLIEEAMNEADFIAIDTEFTGINKTIETLDSVLTLIPKAFLRLISSFSMLMKFQPDTPSSRVAYKSLRLSSTVFAPSSEIHPTATTLPNPSTFTFLAQTPTMSKVDVYFQQHLAAWPFCDKTSLTSTN